jgi:hypothetical protein
MAMKIEVKRRMCEQGRGGRAAGQGWHSREATHTKIQERIKGAF